MPIDFNERPWNITIELCEFMPWTIAGNGNVVSIVSQVGNGEERVVFTNVPIGAAAELVAKRNTFVETVHHYFASV